jgi:hypothetical protein
VITRNEFAHDLLRELGYPRDKSNLYALVALMQAETGSEPEKGAKFNPLNTTKKMPGSTPYNSIGVQNYTSYQQGLDATSSTLREKGHDYGPIRRHLRNADPAPQTLRAWQDSDWGTGGLGLEVLPQVRDDYPRWADLPIAQ